MPAAHAAGGTVRGWGKNDRGQIGSTATNPNPSSVDIPGLSNVVAVAGGNSHSLALRSDGTVWAWGDNASGELGNGTTSPASTATPVQVPGLSNIVAISAGRGLYNLALRSDGIVLAWGENVYGQLGNGTIDSSGCLCNATPNPVAGLSRVVAIAAGDYGGEALRSDGTVWDWGDNEHGTVGNGTVTTTGCQCIPSPRRVTGLSKVVAIGRGSYDGIALRSDGTVADWGWNEVGELGIGSVGSSGCGCSPTPVTVRGLSGVIAADGGYEVGIALLRSRAARGWGYNYSGSVGNGSFSHTGCTCVATPAPVLGLANGVAVAGGGEFAAALLRNGTALGWGRNDDGQVGIGSVTTTGCGCVDSATPVKDLSGASAVATGYYHGLAIVGPSRSLTAATAGSGHGVVGGQGIICPSGCSNRYPDDSYVALRAVPSPGTRFAGFTGACTGTGDCRVRMTTDQRVTATFGPPKGTRITKSTVKRKKHSATFRFGAPGAVTGYECKLARPKRKHHKRPKARFANCRSGRRYRHLRRGKYVFEVRAKNIAGHDPKPAKKRFRI